MGRLRLIMATVLVGALLLVSPAATATGGSRHCDFNGDGFDDAAIGVRGDRVGEVPYAGAVNVIYGSSDGLTAVESQRWTQNSPGVPNKSETGDGFGDAVECGDFNGDGYADLAIGAWPESIGGVEAAGALTVLFGSAFGLDAADSLFIHRDKPGVAGTVEYADTFAIALGVGDFNGDGKDDIAVGAHDNLRTHGGSVQVFHGSSEGLSLSEDRIWHRDRPGIKGSGTSGQGFGYALAPHDFDGDGYDDLAIGVVSDLDEAGSVNVLYGSPVGLTAARNQRFHRDQPGMKGPAEIQFGRHLAAGDFDGDGYADLAVGVDDSLGDFDTSSSAGSVHVLRGTADGLTRTGDTIWHRNTPGIKGEAERNALFGWSLTTGRFNDDEFEDLAIGVHGHEDGAGAVHLIYGSATGLTAAGDQIWHQDTDGIRGGNQGADGFGESVGSGDFNGDGFDDLLIGVPSEGDSIDLDERFGRAAVIYGTAEGLSADGNQSWSQRTPGIPGASEYGERFGWVSGQNF